MAGATKKTSARKGTVHKGAAAARSGAGGARVRKKTARSGEAERSAPPLAEVDEDVLEFIAAIDRFKKQNGRPFPSWSEVLMIVRELGYRRR